MNVKIFLDNVKPNINDIIIEPFSTNCQIGEQFKIIRYGNDTLKRNFVYSNVHYPLNTVHVIGTLPREYTQLAITKACSIADTISIVVHTKEKCVFDADFKCLYTGENINEKVFQIWKRDECEKPLFYTIINPETDSATFAIRRYGIFTGKLVFDTTNLYFSDYFFIKLNDGVDKNLILLLYKLLKFDKRVLTKREIITKLNSLID